MFPMECLYINLHAFTNFQFLSCVWLCKLMDWSMSGFPVLHCLPEFAQIHFHWVNDAIQPFHPLPPSSPPALTLFQHQVFSNELTLCIMRPKYWSFSFNISSSNAYLVLISFRFDWLDPLADKGTLKRLLQHHISKASVVQPSLWSNTHIHTWLLEKS